MANRATRKYLGIECVKLGGSDKMPVSRDGHFLRDVTQIRAGQNPNLRGAKPNFARGKTQIRAGQSPMASNSPSREEVPRRQKRTRFESAGNAL